MPFSTPTLLSSAIGNYVHRYDSSLHLPRDNFHGGFFVYYVLQVLVRPLPRRARARATNIASPSSYSFIILSHHCSFVLRATFCSKVQAVARSHFRRPLPQAAALGSDGDAGRRGVGGLQMLWSGGRRTKGNEVRVASVWSCLILEEMG